MAHTSIAVANKFIELARSDDKLLTPMQIIKLVYISHGWMLALTDKQLIAEDVEAWQYGPVIDDLYQALKHYRSNEVTSEITPCQNERFSSVEESLIGQVYRIYGKYSGTQLSALTHKKDTPWDVTWRKYGQSAVIPQEWIKEHFEGLSERD